MFKKYGWTIVGTIVPTDKKSREDEDIPFLKLSNGAKIGVKYTNKNTGRSDFQVDLGWQILNYSIALDSKDGHRPDYIRQEGFSGVVVKNVFCLNGYISGCKHAGKKRSPVVEFKCGKRLKTDKCTTYHVNIGKASKY